MSDKLFRFKELKTDKKTEIFAGISSFVTMSYILILIPKIMASAGFDYGASLVACAVMAFISCSFMGLYAKLPFATAPYMGESAFLAFTVVLTMGFTPSKVLGILFLCGTILFLLTIFNLRSCAVNLIPKPLKFSFTIGLGMFLAYIGLTNTGIVVIENNSAHIGNLCDIHSILALFGIILIGILTSRGVKSAILIGIFTITAIGTLIGDISLPNNIISSIPSIKPLFLSLDIKSILNLHSLPVIFIVLIIMFTDTMGTTIALASRANLLNKNGNLPDIKKPMLVDSISTILASLLGTITVGSYAESAAGIDSGGKSGLVPIVVGFLFLFALFFSPLLNIIPPYAYGGALVIVGISMISNIKQVDFDDFSEFAPVLLAVLIMALSQNLGIGMMIAFLTYPVFKIAKGKSKELNIAVWILCFISLLFIIFYPYN